MHVPNIMQERSYSHVYYASLYHLMHVPKSMQERSYGLGATCCARIQVYHASVHYKRRLVGALIRLMKQQKRRLRVSQHLDRMHSVVLGSMHSGVKHHSGVWALTRPYTAAAEALEGVLASVKHQVGCCTFLIVSGPKGRGVDAVRASNSQCHITNPRSLMIVALCRGWGSPMAQRRWWMRCWG